MDDAHLTALLVAGAAAMLIGDACGQARVGFWHSMSIAVLSGYIMYLVVLAAVLE